MTKPPAVSQLRLVITCDDREAAVRFFRDVLGMTELAEFESGDGVATLLDAGRATIEIGDDAHAEHIDALEVGRRVAGPIRVALEVADAEKATAAAVAGGATLVAGPVDTPWGSRNARLDAPGGVHLTLFSGDDDTQ